MAESPRTTSTRWFHAALAAIAVFAIVSQLVLAADERGGAGVVNFFSYFTIQSNLLVALAAALIALQPGREEAWFRYVRLAGLVGITITGIVYWTVLNGALTLTGFRWLLDMLLHGVVPLGAVVGFLVGRPRVSLAWRHLLVLLWPVAWLAYTLVRGAVSDPRFAASDTTTSAYPYGFVDVDLHGYGQVAVNALVVTVVFVVVAAVYVWLSPGVPSQPRRTATTSNQ